MYLPPVLSITGSDSTGKAGIQADIKTISAMGGYALTAVTSVTVQNSKGIQHIHDLPPESIVSQVRAIIDDVHPKSIKIGLLEILCSNSKSKSLYGLFIKLGFIKRETKCITNSSSISFILIKFFR